LGPGISPFARARAGKRGLCGGQSERKVSFWTPFPLPPEPVYQAGVCLLLDMRATPATPPQPSPAWQGREQKCALLMVGPCLAPPLSRSEGGGWEGGLLRRGCCIGAVAGIKPAAQGRCISLSSSPSPQEGSTKTCATLPSAAEGVAFQRRIYTTI